MKKRRDLIIALGASALVAPLGLLAQQPARVWRVGFLVLREASSSSQNARAFLNRMRELGYVEGSNLVVEWRFADGDFERLPGLAAELAQLRVDVIVAVPSSAISAAQKATSTIPIVMATAGDPVGSGFVKSLARPGGNITGLSTMGGDTGPKLLDLMRFVVPNPTRVALLENSRRGAFGSATSKSIKAGAQKANVKTLVVAASSPQEIERAFSTMAREKADAVIVGTATFPLLEERQIAELAIKYRLPSMFPTREYVEAGGLMSYGTNFTDLYRRSATYVDKILKGAKPGDLPVEQPESFELVVNLKTAKALGLVIPQSLLVRADELLQ
jgi:putative tryptophan/tyrosine transport system substrate-binding protein